MGQLVQVCLEGFPVCGHIQWRLGVSPLSPWLVDEVQWPEVVPRRTHTHNLVALWSLCPLLYLILQGRCYLSC